MAPNRDQRGQQKLLLHLEVGQELSVVGILDGTREDVVQGVVARGTLDGVGEP